MKFKKLLTILYLTTIAYGCSEDYTGFKNVVQKHHFIEPDGFDREYMNYTVSYKIPDFFNVEKYHQTGSCTNDDMHFGFVHLSNPSQKTLSLPDTVKYEFVTPEEMRFGDDSLKFKLEIPMYYQYDDTTYHEWNRDWFSSDDIINNACKKLKVENVNNVIYKLPKELMENDGRFKIMEYGDSTKAINHLIAFNYTEPGYFVFHYDYPRKDSIEHRENLRKILLSFTFSCEKSKLKQKKKTKE